MKNYSNDLPPVQPTLQTAFVSSMPGLMVWTGTHLQMAPVTPRVLLFSSHIHTHIHSGPEGSEAGETVWSPSQGSECLHGCLWWLSQATFPLTFKSSTIKPVPKRSDKSTLSDFRTLMPDIMWCLDKLILSGGGGTPQRLDALSYRPLEDW